MGWAIILLGAQYSAPEENELANTSIALETFLNEHDVAQMLNVSVATVRRWRLLGKGPKFLKLSSACRYRNEDIDAWLASRPTGGEKLVGAGK